MKTRSKLFTAISSLALVSTVIMTGCGTSAPSQTALAETGILTLSVNPELEIKYDSNGRVIDLSGRNDDGKTIINSYPDYIGKECDDVLRDLIIEINEAGFFVEDIDGNEKNIILQIEPGSVLPTKDFLNEMVESTQDAVKDLDLASGIVTIEDDDYDSAYGKNGGPSHYITLDKAKEIALTQAGINAKDAKFEDKEFDHDDGNPVFELEFTANGNKYEYDIHAITGKVIKAEHEIIASNAEKPVSDKATDYNDTDYGPNNDGVTDYNDTDYGPNNDGVTDYNDTDYGPNNDGVTDYNDTDYGPNNDGVTDYNDTDYGPNNDGVTDYNDTDYGPNNDGVTDYNDTDYGPNNDGVTDYNDTDYGPNNDGVTDYAPAPAPVPTTPPAAVDPGYGDSGYDDGGDSNYGDSNYDDGGSDYDDDGDGSSDYDD